MHAIELLPELWEIILDELSGRQLLDVIRVCKTFEEVIRRSSRLMKKFNLLIKGLKSDDDVLLRSKRKYKNLVLDGSSTVSSHLRKFLQFQQENIENVKITSCSIRFTDLINWIEPISQHIKVLQLFNVTLLAEESEKIFIPFPSLQKLHIMIRDSNTAVNILPMLQEAKLSEFLFMSNCDTGDKELELLANFLISQPTLLSLCIAGNAARRLLNVSKFVDDIKFSLKVLYAELDEDQRLIEFLAKQQTTLKELNFENMRISAKIINHLASFKELRTLGLWSCNYEQVKSYDANFSIRNLSISRINTIHDETTCALLCSMKHAEILNLLSFDISFDVALTIAYKMKSLIQLSLEKCTLMPFTFVNIKRLKFIDIERGAMIKMILVNRQIEKLKIGIKHKEDESLQNILNEIKLNVEFI